MNIVVTGGTKGIGRAIIDTFASQGFNIITCARNAVDLNMLRTELHSKYPSLEVFISTCDMGDKKQVKEFATAIKNKFDTIDILVNNAGLFIPGSLMEEAEGVFETMMNVNIAGTYHITRELMPLIKNSEAAHIFNICSTASITPYSNGGSYCISKFALLGFSKVLREELKTQNIKVTSILPGPTLTNSWAGTSLPNTRFMLSEEVAEAILGCYKLKNTVVEELLMRPQLGDI